MDCFLVCNGTIHIMDFLAIQGVHSTLGRWTRRARNNDKIFLLKETMKKIVRLKSLSISGLLSMYFTFWLVSLLHKWINFPVHQIWSASLLHKCLYNWFICTFKISKVCIGRICSMEVGYVWWKSSTKFLESDGHIWLIMDITGPSVMSNEYHICPTE
jgi:hypothetical protein